MKIETIQGHAVVLHGNDIDTDRILPARFMKSIVFSGIEAHLFEDERAMFRKRGEVHPFDRKAFADESIVIAENNFGCGSSREHAVQALHRNGIRAVIAGSYGEIFLGNCRTVGVAAVQVVGDELETVRRAGSAGEVITISLERRSVEGRGFAVPFTMDEGVRSQFLNGTWDTLSQVLAGAEKARSLAAGLPAMTAGEIVHS